MFGFLLFLLVEDLGTFKLIYLNGEQSILMEHGSCNDVNMSQWHLDAGYLWFKCNLRLFLQQGLSVFF